MTPEEQSMINLLCARLLKETLTAQQLINVLGWINVWHFYHEADVYEEMRILLDLGYAETKGIKE
jgi:hypothetical protein